LRVVKAAYRERESANSENRDKMVVFIGRTGCFVFIFASQLPAYASLNIYPSLFVLDVRDVVRAVIIAARVLNKLEIIE
jgi:hypothetical protein